MTENQNISRNRPDKTSQEGEVGVESCFFCDGARVDRALDQLGDMLDEGVPPEWIQSRMLDVIARLNHHLVDAQLSASDHEAGSLAGTP